MGAWYCTRESVKAAVDVRDTARANAQIDRLIEAESRNVEKFLHRTFYPWTGTRYFDWPDRRSPTPWRLWLGQNEVVSASALTSGGIAISSDDYFLEPSADGPPYNRVEIDRSSSASFISGSTPQRTVGLTGVYMGVPLEERPLFTLSEALDDSEDLIDITDSSRVGVGTVFRVDSERITVVEKRSASLGVTVGGSGLTKEMNATQLTLSATTANVQPGEVLLIEGERMEVVDVAGAVCTVRRAVDGSTAAAHAADVAVYGFRTLQVARGALGTVAATHNTAAQAYEWVPHGPVQTLTLAEVINSLAQENSGYVRVIGSGEGARNASGGGISDIRQKVYTSSARMARTGAI